MHTTTIRSGRHRMRTRVRRATSIAAAGVLGLGVLAVAQPAVGAHQHSPHVKRQYTQHDGLKKATNGLIAFVRAGRIFTADASGAEISIRTSPQTAAGSRTSTTHRPWAGTSGS
jgi:hypothetical protein